MGKRAPSTWVDTLARLRPRDRAAAAAVVPPRPATVRVVVDPAQACALTGAKRAKKKCCRSTPRCKGCPVVLMRAARAAESGLTGKDLAKAVKRARAA